MHNQMKTVALRSLGCKVNAYETEGMQQILQQNGYSIVPFDAKADIYIVNTCSVTNIADQKSRQMLHRAKRLNPDACVIACGCYVQTGGEKLEADLAVDVLVGNNEKRNIVQIINEYYGVSSTGGKNKYIPNVLEKTDYEDMQVTFQSEHTRAFIKIQDGCNQFCSYCVIPYARGRIRSRAVESVIKEIEKLAETGYKEIVLTGIHLSSYGLEQGFESKELTPDTDNVFKDGIYLLELIEKIHSIDGIRRIRLGSLEPRVITNTFLTKLSAMEKVCPHFHLSMQSGCDTVLKRMNRHYSAEEYYEKVELLRRFYDDPAITTDVIVGFPGETDEEFMETYDFVKKVGFYELHVFKYSKRDGTVAAKMPNQVNGNVQNKRSEQLIELGRQMSCDYRKRHIGETSEILFEEIKLIEGQEYWVGHTKEYIVGAVKCSSGIGLENMLISGLLESEISEEVLLFEIGE